MTRAQETYHRQMHRLYRATRARLTLRVSPLAPEFSALLRVAFEGEVERLKLNVPKEG